MAVRIDPPSRADIASREASPPLAHRNPIRTRADWERMRAACLADPGRFHGEIARRELHWFHPQLGARGSWICWSDADGAWRGWDAGSAEPITPTLDDDYAPWSRAFNADDAPFWRWFDGAQTNAGFNEIDRHVLGGHGDETAVIFEGDRWDMSLDGGRGEPVECYPISRKVLMLEAAKCSIALQQLGLQRGDRIALNMPNIPSQLFWTEGAKRLGVVYTPVFGGLSDKTLSDRIHDAGARVVITADGGYRNAQVVPFKTAYTDPALDDYVPLESARSVVAEVLSRLAVTSSQAERLLAIIDDTLRGEVTVQRSDVMRGVGRALQALSDVHEVNATDASRIRTAIAAALVATPPRVDAVIVVRHAGVDDIVWRSERDRWSHELTDTALATLLEGARSIGVSVASAAELLALPDSEFARAVWATSAPAPLDAEFPLFFIYTSGSTGKPKGVVHVHGGYTAGIAHTMRVAFDAQAGDVMYVVADPGWITGQSYMISAALTTRVTSVLTEGAPVFPHAGRFASIIERHKVSIFKAGVTFLKGIMQDPQHAHDVRRYDISSLRVATFCAEPVSPPVQEFGMELLTPWYINSYWATEHGGIAWTHFFGNGEFPLRADAHTYPLPWIVGDVWAEAVAGDDVAHAETSLRRDAMTGIPFRRCDAEEKGEIVIALPYPYLARTVWGDSAGFRIDGNRIARQWKGDIDRWASTYWTRWQGVWAYTQGDFAVRHDDGSFSLHGRSDDVINVSGHRMGTEEIEGAILRHRQLDPDSPVGNVIVVGAPHREKGLTPLAFIKAVAGRSITQDDKRRLAELVRVEKGAVAVPSDFIEVAQFPETRSGKYVRRMVRALVDGAEVGDQSTLRNPESIDELRIVIAGWQRRQQLSDEQQLFDRYRFLRVQYNALGAGARVATVYVTNPPVNALNERALDELNIVVEHLARRDDVKAVVFTGDGTSSFVAGADIRQFLDEIHTLDQARVLPNNAQLAFRRIEQMGKPCIAAIQGVALGGGMEFALACHFRIAEPFAQFGQPEIRLRLLPGYGGTQRLPRLLAERRGADGVRDALDMLLGGRSIDGETALSYGIVDLLASDSTDVLTLAHAHVRQWYRNGGASALGSAHSTRLAQARGWSARSMISLDEVLTDAHLQRTLAQLRWAGREAAGARVLDAVRTGWEQGVDAGFAREAELFAQAVVDQEGGKAGIRQFLDKQSAPLPVLRDGVRLAKENREFVDAQIASGALLPIGAPFYPGITPIPAWQFAFGVAKDQLTGAPMFGAPKVAEQELIVPVGEAGAMEALVYVLASEVNFNDIWAITGIPVSSFDNHELDVQVTGSGGLGLIVSLGIDAKAEGRLKVGDLVAIYSGQSDLLSPFAARDPMFADFSIQGYETDFGSHAQFLVTQAPQLHPVPGDLTLEQAGSYILNLGTIVRALFTTLRIVPGKSMLVEGAATGTGLEALKTAQRSGVRVTGLVSSTSRASAVMKLGATGTINRLDPRFSALFTAVPEDPSAWRSWSDAGEVLCESFRERNDGRMADYVISHAGETAFARSFQLLADGGSLAFYGASSGYHFTFIGKDGSAGAEEMLLRATFRAGEAVLVYYGPDSREIVDEAGLEMIEAVRALRGRCVIATTTDGQREFVQSLGFEAAVAGVVSLEEIARRTPDFLWPRAMPRLPDARIDAELFREAVRRFQDRTLKPFGAAVGKLLRSADNPRGAPDLILERAAQDTLGVSTSLVKPFTGRVVYAESVQGRRYSFYAPQVWTRQRRILMPTASILGTHLANAYEVTRMNDMIGAGLLDVTPPTVVSWDELPIAHQAMWDNTHAGANYLVNHALPTLGLRGKDSLLEAWAVADAAGGAATPSSLSEDR
jgi:acrylyl-CoA reductase (NADPH) / 3-hydroxypropionyl-CoA dehydratase / 3-hydroxypropionyl-CoA synthetase